MKILHISDNHGKVDVIDRLLARGEPVDLLIHSGDVVDFGFREVEKYKDVVKLFNNYPAREKIFVPGNHDAIFEEKNLDYFSVEELGIKKSLESSANVLINDYIMFDGMKIWGTPYQPESSHKSFNVLDEEERKVLHNLIEKDTDILVSHIPPKGVLDIGFDFMSFGDEMLLNRIRELDNLKAVFFGHIHGNLGMLSKCGILFKNGVLGNITECKANYIDLDLLYCEI